MMVARDSKRHLLIQDKEVGKFHLQPSRRWTMHMCHIQVISIQNSRPVKREINRKALTHGISSQNDIAQYQDNKRWRTKLTAKKMPGLNKFCKFQQPIVRYGLEKLPVKIRYINLKNFKQRFIGQWKNRKENVS